LNINFIFKVISLSTKETNKYKSFVLLSITILNAILKEKILINEIIKTKYNIKNSKYP